jgi:hypothetical protein
VIVLAISLPACGHPEQKFAITVIDESGKPVEGIECNAWFKKPGQDSPVKDYFLTGRTDHLGETELVGSTMWGPTSVEASKDGYYPSTAGDHWTVTRNADHWEPWPVKVDLVMKKVGIPKPMYAVKPGTGMKFVVPEDVAQPVGFDLLERDWVEPHGKGQHPDFLLQFQRDDPSATGRFPKGKMKLTFPNPADGIYPAFSTAEGGSILLSPAQASKGGYEGSAEFSSHPHNDGIHPGLAIDRRTWVFRVRTRVDEQGNLASARYGKIQGVPEVIFFSHGPAFRMTYYLNKDPNDRGLEWDMKNNLFADLPERHWPRNP